MYLSLHVGHRDVGMGTLLRVAHLDCGYSNGSCEEGLQEGLAVIPSVMTAFREEASLL